MIEPISTATVTDLDGTIKYVELRQAGNVIRISLEPESSHKTNYKWGEVKKSVDKLAKVRLQMITEDMSEGVEWMKEALYKEKKV